MLYQAMLAQASIDLEVSTERDNVEIRHRIEHEGLSFLTITLPTLSDSLESGLEAGRFTLPLGFKPYRRKGTLPALLQGLFKRVFDLDGKLLDRVCAESIYWIRQICRFFKKPKIPCSPAREEQAIRRFLSVEVDLREQRHNVARQDFVLDEVSRVLWSAVFPTVDTYDLVCAHGPGVTADRLLSNERRKIKQWYDRFEDSFPLALHAFPNYGVAMEALIPRSDPFGTDDGVGSSNSVPEITTASILEETPVRVVFVPKTLKAPRVIAIEPSCMQFVQQGLSRWMVARLESHKLTKRSVRFSDQFHNRKRAYQASIDQEHATIDLSDASDRVHIELVNRIFKSSPILQYLQDARSLHAVLPNDQNIILEKYASMGSALCFPVEASVFYTLILSAMHSHYGVRPTYASIQRYSRDISVFGDDLIIKTELVDVVTEYLESYALRVNHHKSFFKSAFRESCGADFYKGESVLPVYARQEAPARASDWTPSQIMAWVATADQFYLTGRWYLCQKIRDMVEEVTKRPIPRSRKINQGVGGLSLIFDTDLRYNTRYQGWHQRRTVYSPKLQRDEIDGNEVACFNKAFEKFSNRFEQPQQTIRPLGRQSVLGANAPEWSISSNLELQNDGCSETKRRLSRLVGPMVRDLGLPNGGSTQERLYWRLSDMSDRLPRVDANCIDFRNTTKRGVFASKRRWVMIFS